MEEYLEKMGASVVRNIEGYMHIRLPHGATYRGYDQSAVIKQAMADLRDKLRVIELMRPERTIELITDTIRVNLDDMNMPIQFLYDRQNGWAIKCSGKNETFFYMTEESSLAEIYYKVREGKR